MDIDFGMWGEPVLFTDLRPGDCFEDLSGLCAFVSVLRDERMAWSEYVFTGVTDKNRRPPRIGIKDEVLAGATIRIVVRGDAPLSEQIAARREAKRRLAERRKQSNREVREIIDRMHPLKPWPPL